MIGIGMPRQTCRLPKQSSAILVLQPLSLPFFFILSFPCQPAPLGLLSRLLRQARQAGA